MRSDCFVIATVAKFWNKGILSRLDYLDEKYNGSKKRPLGLSVSAQHHICGMASFISVINKLNESYGSYHCGFYECRTSEVLDRVERGLDDLGIIFFTEHSKGQMIQELRNRGIIFNHIVYQTAHAYICQNHPLANSQEIAVIFGGLLGPDIFKVFKTEECKIGGSLVLVVLAPFMAKMGISSGANVAKLVSVGPALLLQEFGNLGTILLSMPLALLLGLKKESIGACYSINRDSNLGLTTDIFGPDAPETKGTFAVYIVGSVIGTVFISILASVVASWNIFDPIALGMASGVGSGSLMTAAAGTLGEIYPQQAENIMIMGGASDMLTGITGIYMGTFVGLPLAKKLYAILEPKIGRKNNQEVK